MELTCFDVTTKDKVAHVQLNRPDALNTMIPAFWTELPQLIGELSDSGEVRAIVISSTGKHFSAGMDLSVFTSSGLSMDGEPGRRNATMSLLVKRLQDSFTALERARVPVLVAIQGGCIGGAVDMVCAADMRYATADAYFVVQETNIGMTADVGTLQRLPKLIPDGIARELVYTGRRMPAARAAQVGLVNEVFDDHESMVAGVLAIAVGPLRCRHRGRPVLQAAAGFPDRGPRGAQLPVYGAAREARPHRAAVPRPERLRADERLSTVAGDVVDRAVGRETMEGHGRALTVHQEVLVTDGVSRSDRRGSGLTVLGTGNETKESACS